MKTVMMVLGVVGVLAAPLCYAQSGADVAKAKGCMNCHDIDKKKAGPSFKDIAAKHKDAKDATPALVAKLKEGKGHAKVSASDADLTAVVQYVLSTK
jgi:cytochrome c